MDEERDKKLSEIENTLKEIHKILRPTRWQMLVQGLWRAVGYVIGLVLAIAIFSWFLNMLGVVPYMGEISNTLRQNLEVVKGR